MTRSLHRLAAAILCTCLGSAQAGVVRPADGKYINPQGRCATVTETYHDRDIFHFDLTFKPAFNTLGFNCVNSLRAVGDSLKEAAQSNCTLAGGHTVDGVVLMPFGRFTKTDDFYVDGLIRLLATGVDNIMVTDVNFLENSPTMPGYGRYKPDTAGVCP
jgi:hypothetical protein